MDPKTAKSEYDRALDLLTRFLAVRDHSIFELKTKLSRRFSEPIIAQALEKADACGWLKSEREIAADAALAYARRGKSQLYIEAELRKRHLPIPARDDEKELENVRNLTERKFGDPKALTSEGKARACRFLRNRGFEDRMIGMVLDGWNQEQEL